MEAKCPLDLAQTGFTRHKSTLTNVDKMADFMIRARHIADQQRQVTKEVEKRERCWVLFIDFAKAFDSVPKEILLNKIQDTAISPYLVHAVAAFLRDTRSTVNDERIDTNIGVPQGTSLSPYAWLLMINDLLVQLREQGHEDTMCFADDLAICTTNLR